jgi:hypothetical protein
MPLPVSESVVLAVTSRSTLKYRKYFFRRLADNSQVIRHFDLHGLVFGIWQKAGAAPDY